MLSNQKKFVLGIITTVFIFSFLFPSPARAQYHDFPGWAGYFKPWTLQQDAKEKQLSLKDKIKEQGLFMLMSSLMNALNYFANKIAYDMGVWLASGDLGQGPFASGKSFGNYLAQVAGDSLGEMLGSLGAQLGLDLCDLPDLRLDLALQLGFHFAADPPVPTCTWQQLRQAYNADNIRSKYASKEGLASRIGMGVQVKDTEFGIWFQSREKMDAYTDERMAGASLDRQEGGGIGALTEIISGEQVVPAVAMKQEVVNQTAAEKNKEAKVGTMGMTTAALGKGATTVALNAVKTFINTALSTVVNNFITKGMLPGGHKICNPGLSITGVGWDQCAESGSDALTTSYYSAGTAGGAGQRRAAQEMFSELLQPKIRTLENYDPTANMAECSPDNLSPDSCIVDQSFLQILQIADSEEPLTIKQALEKGLLHGDWKVYSFYNEAMNQKRDCSQSAYCHRNIRFMRLLRIFPLGFEIAAAISPNGTEPTLQQIIDGYYTEGNPYYKLVNPYWVLSFPKTKCGAYAYSAIGANGMHLQTCADIQHCVGFNKDGSCSNWGYCLREKPIWKFNANYCDSQFNTCRAFNAADGSSGSYLVRTLDTVSCTAENDGCRRYSKYKFYDTATSTVWYANSAVFDTAESLFTNTSVFLNKKASSCNTSDDGCSAYKLASNQDTLLYLKKAPDYLGCYDADTSVAATQLELINEKIASGTQWPVNFSDLSLIQPQDKEACKNYAQVCLPEEENCNNYTSVMTREIIPGKFTPATVDSGMVTWNDQCDGRCNGYAAYREMPGNYSAGKAIDYVVPSSGKQCAATDAGCSAFTNLNSTSAGLSQSEYFSYLRPCILPDQNQQRNYTVYESTEIGGFQIKTYTLVKSDDGNGPKQIYRDADVMEKYLGSSSSTYCGEISYGAGTADPDCHQFIDDQGGVHYAMLSQTVVVSDQCTPYRLNSTELVIYDTEPSPVARCPFDFDNGTNNQAGAEVVEYKDNACYYMGYTGNTNGAGDSVSCTANVESCRAYKGNYGNNVHKLVDQTFEDSTTTDWSADTGITVALSTESTQLDGHSLKISAQTGGITDKSAKTGLVSLIDGKQYMLTFWAKGSLPIDHIAILGSGELRLAGEFTPTDVWKYYSFGPVEYNKTGPVTEFDDLISVSGPLAFFIGNSGDAVKPIYVDNVILTEVEDYLYLVKSTLSVNPICDSNLTDNLPGEALGCSGYQDPLNNLFYLTNFSYLCREAAVGCTAVLDTQNTPDDPYARAYNVWLKGSSGQVASTTFEFKKISCQVEGGATGCYTNFLDIKNIGSLYALLSADKIEFNASTVIIPADTTSTEPIYLVASKVATCKSENMGCQVMGKATNSASGKTLIVGSTVLTGTETFEEVAVKNDPALYDTALCQAEANGCKAWTSGDTNYFFKDPLVGGYGVCDFKSESFTAVAPDPTNPLLLSFTDLATGWVWKDVGACTDGAYGITNYGRACNTDADCTIGGYPGVCKYKNQLPCYPTYKDASNKYGLWSFGNTAKYNNLAGTCPEEQSGCSEFIDHSSAGDNYKCAMSGKLCYADSDCVDYEGDICVTNAQNAYYLIDDQKFSDAQGKCSGQVSAAEGCVLLDKTSNPNKYWHTTSTYASSLLSGDALVAPVENDALNDANIIVKVTHDRVCDEWAYCDLKQEYEDEETGEVKNRCFHLGVCNKAGALDTVAGRVVKDCVSPMTIWDTKGKELDINLYKEKMNAWDSSDFSGYSMDSVFQVPDISARPIKPDGADKATYRLVHVFAQYGFDYNNPGASYSCDQAQNDGGACGQGVYSGKCYNGECVTAFWNDAAKVVDSTILTCRAYPEETAPFRDNILVDRLADVLEYKEGFQDSNLCYNNSGNPTDCDYADFCSYRKMSASAGDVLKPITESIEANYICVGGTNNGHYCSNPNSTSTCGEEGICSPIKSTRLMSGWMGYCMESDYRQTVNGTTGLACMTWWPIESPPGVPNYWDTDPDAGYEIAEGPQDRFMCVENEPILNRDRGEYSSEANGQINLGGLLVGIDTAINDSDQTCFNDYSVQTMPKNNSYKIINQSDLGLDDNSKFAFTNLPSNVAVSGCYTTANDGEYVWGMAVDHSAAMYCPINRDTLILDGDKGVGEESWVGETMALCTSIQGTGTAGMSYDEEQERWECDGWNPWQDNHFTHEPFHWGNARWAGGYGAKFFNRNEIEQIDVFIDETAAHTVRSDGWVSFIRDSVDADSGVRSFVMEESWVNSPGDSSIHSVNLDDAGLYGWYAWQYYGGSGSTGWNISDGTNDKNKIVSQGIDTNSYNFVNVISTAADTKNIGIRVVWDENDNLRGIWLNQEATDADADGLGDSDCDDGLDMGIAFVIHFTHGKCNKFVQISNSASSTGIDFKPYPNYLNNDEVSQYESDASRYPGKTVWDAELYYPRLTADLNGGKYGTAFSTEDGYIDIRDKTAAFINPFTYYEKIVHDREFFHAQSGDINLNYEFTGYNAGVALVSADSRTAKSNHDSYFDYTTPGIPNNTPYGTMLMRMFAKVSNFWRLGYDDGFNNGYTSYYGSVDAANPLTAGEISGQKIYPPKVAAPTDDGMQLDAVSVNGTTSGNIYLISGSQTHIKFYAWAHGNQMPLRRVVASKGDGKDNWVDTGLNDALSNRKVMCDTGKICGTTVEGWQYPCNESADCSDISGSSCIDESEALKQFGNTADTGCKAKPWDIVADYNCPFGQMEIVQNGDQPDVEIAGQPVDWDYVRHNFYDAPYVCVARPSVYAQDNWGWCASRPSGEGGCASNANVVGYGCYGDQSPNRCLDNGIEPWVNYNGYVIVVPVVQ